jgi:hypothetical protein
MGPQKVVFCDEDKGPRWRYAGYWYRFVKKCPAAGPGWPEDRWMYVPE